MIPINYRSQKSPLKKWAQYSKIIKKRSNAAATIEADSSLLIAIAN
jgi:hypothetical protein